MSAMKKRRKTILITAGPTREHIDPVRFISNLSTGELGYTIAAVARKRGYQVILISGPTALPLPRGVRVVPVTSARDLERETIRFFKKIDILFMTGAVCDFRPVQFTAKKIKRRTKLSLHLTATHDILHKVARKKTKQILCGFCLETNRLERNALQKLRNKGLDIIVAHTYSKKVNPFGQRKTKPLILTCRGARYQLAPKTKKQIAVYLLQLIERGI